MLAETESDEAGIKPRELSRRRAQRRKRILKIVVLIDATLSVVVVLLSLTSVQQAFFPMWLIEIWRRLLAAFVVLVIASVILLPTVIEANLNPRALAGPGKDRPSAIISGKPPFGG